MDDGSPCEVTQPECHAMSAVPCHAMRYTSASLIIQVPFTGSSGKVRLQTWES